MGEVPALDWIAVLLSVELLFAAAPFEHQVAMLPPW
jgi:hypothetical protein